MFCDAAVFQQVVDSIKSRLELFSEVDREEQWNGAEREHGTAQVR